MSKDLYTVQALFYSVVGIVCNDKVSQELLSSMVCLVLIISFFERMSHAEPVKFIFKMTKNEPCRISQIYFQNDTFAKCAILRTR